MRSRTSFQRLRQEALPLLARNLDLVVRKIGHAGVFGILALLLWRAVGMTTDWHQPRTPAVALGLTVGYAITDEQH